jgi:hypothetical protein
MRETMSTTQARGVLAMTLVLAACGSQTPTASTTTPTPAPQKAVISAAIAPNPVVSTPNTDDATKQRWPFLALFSVTVTEKSGLACNINRILVNFPGNPDIVYNPIYIQSVIGNNFVAGNGTLSVPIFLEYVGVSKTSVAAVSVTVEVIDAKNNVVTSEAIVVQLT